MATSIQEMQWVLRAQVGDREALEMLLLLTFISGARAVHADGGMVQAVLAHFFMLLIWVTALTLVVVIQITVMTKRILRAIELALRK